MSHFVVTDIGLSTLASTYPHSPENFAQSIQDYLEAQLGNGLFYVSMQQNPSTGSYWFVFKVVAQ
jgi:hypothetical protein